MALYADFRRFCRSAQVILPLPPAENAIIRAALLIISCPAGC
ncbi:hypothetical protein HMPREF0758_3406 [Serratia odorifera DSM 4582]|uniref:Uncharacterized protein n=1 Tax=Serratia odorifera DSM 4582 TaxID=667129 RepID=D4E5F6_SEROD|nr:hypothetical protein HMPREF0758_3406 [Serratia odorifera DSM 4582]